MATNGHHGELAASIIDVEITRDQEITHGIVKAGERLHEKALTLEPPSEADINAVQIELDKLKKRKPIEISRGTPLHHWQGWLIERWLPTGCVAMLTGDGGIGKSMLALQLAWALSGSGQFLGEAGQMPIPGADYGNDFEPLSASNVVYATWEDSPAQIRGRLYWLDQYGKVGDGDRLAIADMRSHGPAWSATDKYALPGLTDAGRELRAIVEAENARLLVVDTLGVANGASEIDRAQVGAFFANWGAWAEAHNCAVLLVAHPPKGTGATYSGSTGMLGGVRAMWSIRTVHDTEDKSRRAYQLVNEKQNYGRRANGIWLNRTGSVWVETDRPIWNDGKASDTAPEDRLSAAS